MSYHIRSRSVLVTMPDSASKEDAEALVADLGALPGVTSATYLDIFVVREDLRRLGQKVALIVFHYVRWKNIERDPRMKMLRKMTHLSVQTVM